MTPAALEAAEALRDELEKPDRSLTLYQLVDALSAIDEHLDENGGELTPEIEAMLSALEGSFDAKVDSVCILRQNALADAQKCQTEVERLEKRAEAFRKKAESLRHFLHGAMIQTGKEKVKTARFTVYRQQNPLSVRWTRDLSELPEDWRRIRIEPDLALARDRAKEGHELPAGFEVVHGEHIRVR